MGRFVLDDFVFRRHGGGTGFFLFGGDGRVWPVFCPGFVDEGCIFCFLDLGLLFGLCVVVAVGKLRLRVMRHY